MFSVNYEIETGNIVSYQGGGDGSENDCPDGCDTLVFADVVDAMYDTNRNVIMKVDLKTKKLVFINPVVIPEPIQVA